MCLVALEHCGRRRELLNTVAARLDATPMGVALAWLLERSPNILLIPGTSSIEHLRENVTGAALKLPTSPRRTQQRRYPPRVTLRSNAFRLSYATPRRALRPVGLFARLEKRVWGGENALKISEILGWPGVEPGRPFGLQIFAPLWLWPPRLRVCGPDCALTL